VLARLLLLAIPLCAGVALGSQAPTNAALARYVGPVRATWVSVVVSLICLSIGVAINREGGNLLAVANAPRWTLLGGCMGVIALVGTVVSVPRLGAAATITLIVVGQLATAAAVDHYGWLGVAQRSLDAPRLLGLALLVAGGVLVVRR